MRKILWIGAVLLCQFSMSQSTTVNTDDAPVAEKSKWTQKNKASVDISEVTFVNWSAGGSNSISGLLGLTSSIDYTNDTFYWKSKGDIRYGVNKQESQSLRKTEDLLEISSNIGYRKDSLTNWFFSAHFNFKSQFTNGYNYPNRTNAISRFMAPGYMLIGGGAEYGKDLEKFSFYFSPFTVKTTFVLDQTLADKGAFGVEPALYDLDGNRIKRGQKSKNEVGILVTHFFETDMFENIKISTKLNLYTDYIKSFGNVDVDWLVNFEFKVNQFVRANLSSHLRYDDDIKTTVASTVTDELIERGAKVQWKQLLGIGVAVNF